MRKLNEKQKFEIEEKVSARMKRKFDEGKAINVKIVYFDNIFKKIFNKKTLQFEATRNVKLLNSKKYLKGVK